MSPQTNRAQLSLFLCAFKEGDQAFDGIEEFLAAFNLGSFILGLDVTIERRNERPIDMI